uniref:Multivesicular body subunit 12A n=1 Tax=Strix occidentalis caurina TaxID=311401 RepID=A0A8D0FJS2_STROC
GGGPRRRKEAPPPGPAITVTVEGAAANLGKGFGHKGGGYLCVSRGGAQVGDQPGAVTVPGPAARLPPAGPGLSRKKRVYVKLVPPEAAGTALFALQLSSKSRALPQHLKIGEIGNFALWCKKGPVLHSSPQPVPRPRTISASLKQLSLQAPDSDPSSSWLFLKPLPLLFPAMDGVPFTLHPRFESKLSSGSNAILANLNVKSLADIEEEYNYAFVVERTAAARLPPGVC